MEEASKILNSYFSIIFQNPLPLSLPNNTIEDIETLLRQARAIFKKENSLLTTNGPAVIVGDLHGNVFDLYKILKEHPIRPNINYIFLGDLVDRGENSLDVVLVAFSLKILYPRNVFIIRGNHESEYMTKKGGFYSEVQVKYHNSRIYKLAMKAFSHLPFALLLNHETLCVHGGISPELRSLYQIAEIKRPISKNISMKLINDLLWSDPIVESSVKNLDSSLSSRNIESSPVLQPCIQSLPRNPTNNEKSADKNKFLVNQSLSGNQFINNSAEPTNSTPTNSTPTNSTPMNSTPMNSTPMKPTPTKPTPMKPTPMKSTPMKSTPTKSTPTNSTPMNSTPMNSTPMNSTPMNSTPMKPTTTKPTPMKPTPMKPTPTNSTPTKSTPMKPPPADQKNEENTENASKSNNSLAARDFCESKRGIGCLFGERALTAFLTQNNIKRVVRGHECVFEGYRLSFNEKLITVFSASNYCGYQNNNGAVMIFDSQNNYKFDTYSIERDIESGQAIVQQPQPGKKKYSGKRSSNMKSVKLFGAPPKASIRKWNSDLEDTNNQLSLKVKSFNINKGNIITRRQKVCSIQPSSVKFSMSSPEVRLQDIEFNLT